MASSPQKQPDLVASGDVFDRRVLKALRRLAWRLRGAMMITGLARVLAWVLIAAAASLGLDALWHLPRDMRAALLLVAVVGIAVAIWRRIIQPLGTRLSAMQMAELVERRFPQLGSVLISAVFFARPQPDATGRTPETASPALIQQVIDQATAAAATVRIEQVLDARHVRWRLAAIVAAVLVFVASFVAVPQTMGLWLDRCLLLRSTPWPQRTRLVVDLPGNVLRARAVMT